MAALKQVNMNLGKFRHLPGWIGRSRAEERPAALRTLSASMCTELAESGPVLAQKWLRSRRACCPLTAEKVVGFESAYINSAVGNGGLLGLERMGDARLE